MNNRKTCFGLLLGTLLLWICAIPALAVVVEPTGDTSGWADRQNIHHALQDEKKAELVSGATYYIKSTIYMESGDVLDAKDATIIALSNCVRNKAFKTNYKAFDNITIRGGTWKSKAAGGNSYSQFQFVHGSNLVMEDMNIQCASITGHAIEIIACRNVVIRNCTVTGKGKNSGDQHEEQIQIDVATKNSAFTIGRYYEEENPGKSGSFLINNAACKNVVIDHCTVKNAAKGICANQDPQLPGNKRKFHTNIKVTNCNVTTTNGQGIILSNVIGATITGNTVINKMKNISNYYSTGISISTTTTPPSAVRKAAYIVSNNTVKGGRSAISLSLGNVRAKSLTIQKNKMYCRLGKGETLFYTPGSAKKITVKKNKSYKW